MMKSDAAGIGYQYHYRTKEFICSFYPYWNTEGNLSTTEMYPIYKCKPLTSHVAIAACFKVCCVPMTYSLIPIAALTLQIFITTTT